MTAHVPVHVYPDGTIDSRPCVKCGKQTLSLIEVAVFGNAATSEGVPEGTVIDEVFICRPCCPTELAQKAAVN